MTRTADRKVEAMGVIGHSSVSISILALGVGMFALATPAGAADSAPSRPAPPSGLRIIGAGPAVSVAAAPAATPRTSTTRHAAVAGLFYPKDPKELGDKIDELLRNAPAADISDLRALICPHAGYEFSGRVAAAAYKTLAGKDVDTVIAIGPSHYAAFRGISLPVADFYETPLGDVRISTKAKLWTGIGPCVAESKCDVVRPAWSAQSPKAAPEIGQDTPETWEHSVEVQVPFLQRALKSFELLPMVMGQVSPAEVADFLAPRIDDKTIVVASSDLSHYHPYDVARRLDAGCIQTILDGNIEAMAAQEACGKGPVLALMHLAKAKGWKARLLDSCNSGDVSGDKDRVVGYAAVAFYAPKPPAYGAEERKFMLGWARRTLANVVTNGAIPDLAEADTPPKLREKRACFVTLTKRGALRGCIGSVMPQEPLYRAVLSNARNAALSDPRFPALAAEELDSVRIEVSVLTEPQPLAFGSPEDLLAKLQAKEDGVVLRIGPRMATFLPQVWAQIPDKTDFLNHLAVKAGCDSSAWRGKEVSVSTYRVESFEEPEHTVAHH